VLTTVENKPSLAYRFVTTQMQLMKLEKMSKREVRTTSRRSYDTARHGTARHGTAAARRGSARHCVSTLRY
jgi:hypothetical protein